MTKEDKELLKRAMQYVESRYPSDCPYYVQLVRNTFDKLKQRSKMAAKDYTICEGMMGLYFAKTSKKEPHRMLNDRRLLTDLKYLVLSIGMPKLKGVIRLSI